MQVPVDVHPGKNAKYPAGPALLPRLLSGGPFRQNQADFFRQIARQHGDLVHFRAFDRHIYTLNHPDLIADFFLKDAAKHHRNLVMQRARDVLGTGLLTSEEPLHMRQRRLMQPAFLRERIQSYGRVIGDNAMALGNRWRALGNTAETPVDLHPHMLELALRIVGKCLFDVESFEDYTAMEHAVDSFMNYMPLSILPFAEQIQKLPLPPMRRLEAGKKFLDELIYATLAERRRSAAAEGGEVRDRGDLLSMLLNAVDTETDGNGASGAAMTDRQLRDECVTIILAGHETTANALSFSLDLLARHPAVQEQLAAEARAVLGADVPDASHYAPLPFATQVFAEAMRMYPPVWTTGRTSTEAYDIAGYRIPAGATLLAPQCAVHSDPRFYPEPSRFDPARFTAEAKAARPRYAYFPFAGGSRQCIAEGLAWMEGTLVLAAVARDWRLTLPPGAGPVRVKPAVTLRPSHGIRLLLSPRTA